MDNMVKVRWFCQCLSFETLTEVHGGDYRNFELIKLQMKHIKFESDQNLYGLEYIDLFLSNRKGWQRRMDKGVVETDLRSKLLLFHQT
jgi:hypothetical protein